MAFVIEEEVYCGDLFIVDKFVVVSGIGIIFIGFGGVSYWNRFIFIKIFVDFIILEDRFL